MPACERDLALVGWATVESTRLLPGRMARTLPSRRPKLLNRADQVGAVRLANKIKHASRAISSKLLVQSASERLLLWPAALEGCIRHGLSGTRAAQVSFGGGCRALYPLIPELLNIGGQRSRAGRLELRRGGGSKTLAGDGFRSAGGKRVLGYHRYEIADPMIASEASE